MAIGGKMNGTIRTEPIAESDNFIVLERYVKHKHPSSYQTEVDLERELIKDLQNQGYEYLEGLHSEEALLANLRTQIEALNEVRFSNSEWRRFLNDYLNRVNDSFVDRTNKLHNDYQCDFTFDDGRLQNIYIWDKKNINRNKLQVINQMEQVGKSANRYDVTILVNGLPLVQIELKRRGVAIREAFGQLNRYTKESFNKEDSLFQFLQIFVISNGTDTRYFSNTTKREKNSFDFTMNWALRNNDPIKDLKDFTATFLSRQTLLNVLINYSVFDVNNNLLIMRPYQIAATERIIWKIRSSIASKVKSGIQTGGYIWHTTGSGKTLTSFKAARLATQMDEVDKVFFVVDRKDLDYQTMKEYQRFSKDSVNGSNSTRGLRRNIEKDDNKIVVTTIQKLNRFMKSEAQHDIYNKQVVFIFDECHRSQFGEVQKLLRQKFKKYCQFGFTGTPIMVENALGDQTTASVFGQELHNYTIVDAIRDQKVLKFMVTYNDVRPKFKTFETENDINKLSAWETKQALLHPDRITEISRYVLDNFKIKTHRHVRGSGFNAMFAVSSVDAAKAYYQELKKQQSGLENPLKIATIFSYAPNEEQASLGDIIDETFDPVNMTDNSNKEFLRAVINDYNGMFGTSYSIDGDHFQDYYKDLAKRVKNREVDLLIVVGMFLTGFDAPRLNTLFVDKNLRYHGLIQAFSRTNRIFDSSKNCGNIVTFRDLEEATTDALRLFGNNNTSEVVLERPYRDYMHGYVDNDNNQHEGYLDICRELLEHFPDPANIDRESDKKAFVNLFGKFLRLDNNLRNYDDFTRLKFLQSVDFSDSDEVEKFKTRFNLSDDKVAEMRNLGLLTERQIQDYKSAYNDIRDWITTSRSDKPTDTSSTVDWDSVVFEVELLKSQEINLDYILELIFETNKKISNKDALIAEIRRFIRSSLGYRAKEGLIVDFIRENDLDSLSEVPDLIEKFFEFARKEARKEAANIIREEGLNESYAKRYINTSLRHGHASENGDGLNNALPKMSPISSGYGVKKSTVLLRISAFVDKFKETVKDISL